MKEDENEWRELTFFKMGNGRQFASLKLEDGRLVYDIIGREQKQAIQRRGRILTWIAVAIFIVVFML